MATTLEVHGGDFTRGFGWFYRDGSFVLRAKNGRPEGIPASQLEAVDHASEILEIFDAAKTLRNDFEHATVATGQTLFIAVFADGRMLLASTDQPSFEQICAARK